MGNAGSAISNSTLVTPDSAPTVKHRSTPWLSTTSTSLRPLLSQSTTAGAAKNDEPGKVTGQPNGTDPSSFTSSIASLMVATSTCGGRQGGGE